jgi:hypothetical protein
MIRGLGAETASIYSQTAEEGSLQGVLHYDPHVSTWDIQCATLHIISTYGNSITQHTSCTVNMYIMQHNTCYVMSCNIVHHHCTLCNTMHIV